MRDTYEISEAATNDWRKIASYTLKSMGESDVKRLSKALDQGMVGMARDHKSTYSIKLYNEAVRVAYCQEHFILGVFRLNRPLLVFAILHKDIDLMQRLAKNLRIFDKPYSHYEYLESLREKQTLMDESLLIYDDEGV